MLSMSVSASAERMDFVGIGGLIQMQLTFLIFLCCLFPFFMTVCGAAAVFLCPHGIRPVSRQIFLGFAAGVMLAASVWSLLTPAIAAAEALGLAGWIPASAGIVCGVLFLLVTDLAAARVRRAHRGGTAGTSGDADSFLLQLAMTVHNIPEGMAVGLSVALAAEAVGDAGAVWSAIPGTADHAALSAALALSLGIGIQNFPEGAAVSLPLRQDGMGAARAFLRGCLSGIVEPIFGFATVLFLTEAAVIMPWLLSFAAGAMLYVVAEELIPASHGEPGDGVSFVGTLSTVGGFLVMMVLDLALG